MNNSTNSDTIGTWINGSSFIMSDRLKCCIEKQFAGESFSDGDHTPDVIEIIEKLHSILQPCEIYFQQNVQQHSHKLTMYLKMLLLFYLNGSDDNTDCQNYFCEQPTSHWMVFYMCILFLTLIISVSGNAFVFTVISRANSLRKRATYKLLASLSVSDFLVSAFVLPIKLTTASTNLMFCNDVSICRLYTISDITFFAASVTHLLAVAVDRYLSITKPYHHEYCVVIKKWKSTVTTIWLYSIVWGIASNLNMNTWTFHDTVYVKNDLCQRNNDNFIQVLYIVVFFVPCSIMIYIYFAIWRIAVRQAQEIKKISNVLIPCKSRSIPDEQLNKKCKQFLPFKKSDLKASMIILKVFGTFLVCWTPMTVMTFVHTFTSFTVSPVVYTIFFDYLPNLNSCLNPFIYCFFHREFKKELKTILERSILRSQHRSSIRKREKQRMISQKQRL